MNNHSKKFALLLFALRSAGVKEKLTLGWDMPTGQNDLSSNFYWFIRFSSLVMTGQRN